jgi:LacI family transcriptional regulator
LAPLYRRSGTGKRGTATREKLVADGMIVSLREMSKAFDVGKIPVVGIDVREPIPGVPNVTGDADAIAAIAIEHFLERGFKRFAYCGLESIRWAEERSTSFYRQLVDAGYQVHMYERRRRRRISWYKELDLISDWLQKLPVPIALFACNDERARQVSDACRIAGLRVPDDIAILGVDNDELVCVSQHPPLSSVALNFEQAGFDAAQLLNELMAHRKKAVSQRITIKATHVVTRQSTDILAIEDPVVAEAVRFIRANCRRPIQVPDVLREVTISRRSLYDRFKRVLGCSVYEYIKRVRVGEIERLLLDTDYSVTEIADLVGFSTPDHIASYFRSVRGINPLTLRLQSASR